MIVRDAQSPRGRRVDVPQQRSILAGLPLEQYRQMPDGLTWKEANALDTMFRQKRERGRAARRKKA